MSDYEMDATMYNGKYFISKQEWNQLYGTETQTRKQIYFKFNLLLTHYTYSLLRFKHKVTPCVI